MAVIGSDTGSYSLSIGLVYLFNIIVGNGVLAMPLAFYNAGYVLGIAILSLSCLVSYISATFVVESMALANQFTANKNKGRELSDDDVDDDEDDDVRAIETRPLITASASNELYDANLASLNQPNWPIKRKFEISEMASLYFGNIGIIVFQIIMALYLFGDMAIYIALVSKSVMTVVCSFNVNVSCSERVRFQDQCLPFSEESIFSDLTRENVYWLAMCIFVLTMGPFIFVGVSKTKYLQVFTTMSRWTALLLMMALAVRHLITSGVKQFPPVVNFSKFGSLFGVAVYSFMCHHSLPGFVTPITNKSHLSYSFFLVFFLIFCFYTCLAVTGAFAYSSSLLDVYTFNFFNNLCDAGARNSVWLSIIYYFLGLFPVFTLSTNLPVIGITLKNNLKSLALLVSESPTPPQRAEQIVQPVRGSIERENEAERHSDSALLAFFNSTFLPFVVIFVPFAVAFFVSDIEILASITGSFPGVGVEYVLPAALVLGARKRAPLANLPTPFGHWIWPVLVLLWSFFTVVVVAANFVAAAL